MRCLLVTTSPTQPPVTGDRQRTALLLRAMRSVAEVDVLLVTPQPVPAECQTAEGVEHLTHLTRCWPEQRGALRVLQVFGRKWSRRLAHNSLPLSIDHAPDIRAVTALRRMVEQRRYDLIVCRYLTSALWTGADRYAPTVLDIDDMMSQAYRSRREGHRRWLGSRLMLHWYEIAYRRFESRAWRRHAHVWVANESDLDQVDHPSRSVLPNIAFGVDEKPQPTPPPDSHTLLIVGTMVHAPNVEGIERFLRQVWPTVRRRVPQATLLIAGWGMSEGLRRKWSQEAGVRPLGFVQDLAEVYGQCAAAVAPMYHGGGTKIKVLEALSYGRPIVATAHAMRGYERRLPQGRGVWVAADDVAMIEGCCQMLTDAALRGRYAAAGRDAVREHFSFQAFHDEVANVLQRVAGQGPLHRVD